VLIVPAAYAPGRRPNTSGAGVANGGHFLGDCCLAGHNLRLKTATALSATRLMRYGRAAFAEATHDDPAFAAFFIERTVLRKIEVERALAGQLSPSVEERLVHALLGLADHETHARDKPISVAVNQVMLAEMIGATRSHVNRFMNKFRRLGWISYESHAHESIVVHPTLSEAVLASSATPE
jgi:CRP-like cAMP-binding protein